MLSPSSQPCMPTALFSTVWQSMLYFPSVMLATLMSVSSPHPLSNLCSSLVHSQHSIYLHRGKSSKYVHVPMIWHANEKTDLGYRSLFPMHTHVYSLCNLSTTLLFWTHIDLDSQTKGISQHKWPPGPSTLAEQLCTWLQIPPLPMAACGLVHRILFLWKD